MIDADEASELRALLKETKARLEVAQTDAAQLRTELHLQQGRSIRFIAELERLGVDWKEILKT